MVVGPVRSELERRLSVLRDEAIVELEQLLGREVTYSRISPSILRYLSVSDLTVHGLTDEASDLVTIQNLRIYYRPLALIRGEYEDAFTELRIENSTLFVDTRRDTDLVAILSDIAGSREARGAETLVPESLKVSGRNIRLQIVSELGVLQIGQLFFESSVSGDVLSLRASGELTLSEMDPDLPLSRVDGRLSATGTLDLTSGDALFDVALPELRSDIASLRRQVFQVNYRDNVLEARKIQDRNPVDLYFRLQMEPMELYARVLSDGYRLADLVRLEGEYEPYNDYLRSPIRGQASVTLTAGGFSYGGSILTRATGLPVPDGDVTIRFSGDERDITVDSLEYASEIGEIEFTGVARLQPFRPSGRVTVRNLVYGGIAPLSLSADIVSRGDTIAVDAGRFTYAGVTIADASAYLTLAQTPFAEATLLLGPRGDRRIEIASEHGPDGALRRATVDARSVLPRELERLQVAVLPDLSLPDLSLLPSSLVVDTRIAVDLTDELSVNVPLFYAVDGDHPQNHVSFSLAYSGEEVAVRDATVAYNGYTGRGDFRAELGRAGVITFESDVVVQDIPYQFTGVYDPSQSLEIRGLHDVDARFYFGERDELIFRASGNIPLPLPGTEESRLAFAGDGYIFSGSDWLVTVETLSASGVPYYAIEDASISLSGQFGPAGGRLTSVGYSDAYSVLSGSGALTWDLAEGAGTVELTLADSNALESYSGSAAFAIPALAGQLRNGSREGLLEGALLELNADFSRLPLLRAGITTLRGSVDGSLALSGPVESLTTELTAMLRDGRFNSDPVEIAGTVRVGPEGMTLADASGRYIRTRFENVSANLLLRERSARLEGTIVQSGESGNVVVGVTAVGQFTSDAATIGDALQSDFAARAVLSNLPVEDDLPTDWQFEVSRSGGILNVNGGPEDALSGRIDQDGDFTLAVRRPVPLSFDAAGSLAGGQIEADLIGVRADIARLWQILDDTGVNFISGVAEGSARIVGPLNDPDFYGTLIASNITGTVDMVVDLIGPARTVLVFDEKVLTVRETVVPAGSGLARISAAVTLDRWLPEEYRVWITTLEDGPIRVSNDFGGVAMDGLAAGSVRISGSPDVVQISGQLVASAMDITLSEVEEGGEPADDAGEMVVDVNVTTGRGVQFLWPTDAFPILRGFADVGETVRITHRSSTGGYTVDGRVDIQGGEVFYFDRSFYIREGRMTFAEDQSDFDPLLTVDAEIREVGPDGPVRIYLVSAERPLSQFTPQWRSEPPLPEAEIIALLGGNVFVTEGGDPINLSQAVLLTSDLVSQFGIIRGVETSIREFFQLDLFSIRTQLFQNLIRGVIDQGEYPLDSTVPSLGQYLDNTTLFLGKYLGTDLFLELLVQLRATDPIAETTRSLAGIAVEPEFSLEWETPFFLLEWSFFPTDPSSLFLRDNTISFTWEYSY